MNSFKPTEAEVRVLQDITAERERQDQEWGGPAHDDTHGDRDWIVFIVKHLGRVMHTPERSLLVVVSLAVAALQWLGRRYDTEDAELATVYVKILEAVRASEEQVHVTVKSGEISTIWVSLKMLGSLGETVNWPFASQPFRDNLYAIAAYGVIALARMNPGASK